jgi:uncharacterized protein with HEPN domain
MSDDEAQALLDNHLSNMLEAAQLARQYVEGVSKNEFLTDRRTQQAVVLNLMTNGEAAARAVNECKEFAVAHPQIPWAQMRGMYNRMVHGYLDVDLNVVWDTVQSSLGRTRIPAASSDRVEAVALRNQHTIRGPRDALPCTHDSHRSCERL